MPAPMPASEASTLAMTRNRLYDGALFVLFVAPVAAALLAVSEPAQPRREAAISAVGLSGFAPGWGSLRAPSIELDLRQRRVLFDRGMAAEQPGSHITAGWARLSFDPWTASLREVKGTAGGTAFRVAALEVVATGNSVARGIVARVSFRHRRIETITIRSLSANAARLRRLKSDTRPEPADAPTTAEPASVEVRVGTARDGRLTPLVLHNVQVIWSNGSRLRAQQIHLSFDLEPWLCEGVSLHTPNGETTFEEMTLDPRTWLLAPRRSVVDRVFGQAPTRAIPLDALEILP